MQLIRFTQQIPALGAIVSALGCASCFPLLGSIGAALGMGALARFEGAFINTLLPVFAWLALGLALLSLFIHRRWIRFLFSVAGPLMVLATLHLFWTDNWSTYMFYLAIGLMLLVSIYDVIRPARRHCSSGGCL